MAKSAARQAKWRRRMLLKSSIFDDLNAVRAARIRVAFLGDDRPEVRAVVEFFANYPRCQAAPKSIELVDGAWHIDTESDGSGFYEPAAAVMAMQEATSLPVYLISRGWLMGAGLTAAIFDKQVRDEVAEMRALGLWGQS